MKLCIVSPHKTRTTYFQELRWNDTANFTELHNVTVAKASTTWIRRHPLYSQVSTSAVVVVVVVDDDDDDAVVRRHPLYSQVNTSAAADGIEHHTVANTRLRGIHVAGYNISHLRGNYHTNFTIEICTSSTILT